MFNKKRNFQQFSETSSNQPKAKAATGKKRRRRTLKRTDEYDEEDDAHDNTYDKAIEAGGSSQEKFESDFIDDDGSEAELAEMEKAESGDEYGTKKKKKKGGKKPENRTPVTDPNEETLDNVDEFLSDSGEEDYIKKRQKGQKITPQQKSKKKEVSKNKNIVQQSDDEKSESEEDNGETYEKLPSLVNDAKDLNVTYKFNTKNKKYYLTGDFSLPAKIYDNLFDHQKQGIEWLYNLWDTEKGGILGDDMGLGKTVQVAGYLSGLFAA